MKRSLLAAMAVGIVTLAAGFCQADDKITDNERDFLRAAARGGMVEVKLGESAASQGKDGGVQTFGKRMVEDHNHMADELKALAKKKDVGLPDELGEKHKTMIDDVKKKSGSDFDKAYIKMMIHDHQEDLADFRKMSNDAKDGDIRAFATKYTSMIEEHLQMARDEAKSLGIPVEEGKKKK